MTGSLELIKTIHCTMLLSKCLKLFEGEVHFSQYTQPYFTAKNRVFIACYIAMSISVVCIDLKSCFSFSLVLNDVKYMQPNYQNVDFYNILLNSICFILFKNMKPTGLDGHLHM